MVQVTNKELILQLRYKKEDAFNYLYDHYAPALLNIINSKIKSSVSSEELLQKVFLKILTNFKNFDATKGSLFVWMLQITCNEAKDFFRMKNIRNKEISANSLGKENTVGFNNDLEINSFNIIKHLPFKERVLMELNCRGFSCSEIGKLLKLPETTIKLNLLIAHKKLK
jgi:RNA polymerase sigma-70 factor (ECF subfamily)